MLTAAARYPCVGDFLPRCQANPDKTCFSLPAFAHEVANMRKRLLDERGIADAQVIFTTNERDKGFLEAARKLGWKRITDEEELRMRHEYGDWCVPRSAGRRASARCSLCPPEC
jgi:hypothetical protein